MFDIDAEAFPSANCFVEFEDNLSTIPHTFLQTIQSHKAKVLAKGYFSVATNIPFKHFAP